MAVMCLEVGNANPDVAGVWVSPLSPTQQHCVSNVPTHRLFYPLSSKLELLFFADAIAGR